MARVAYSNPSYSTTFLSQRYQSRSRDPVMNTAVPRKNYDGVQSSGYGQASKPRTRSYSSDRGSSYVPTHNTGRVANMTVNYNEKVFGHSGSRISEKYSQEYGSSTQYGSDRYGNAPLHKPPSGSRRLPPNAPGYTDESGRKLPARDAISDVHQRLKGGPVKATREDYDPKNYRGNSPRPTSRGSLEHRLDSMSLTNDTYGPRTSNLIHGRTKFGSTSSLASPSRETFVSESVSSLTSQRKGTTHVQKFNLSNDSSTARQALPNLSDSRAASLSRDNSLEGGSSSVQQRSNQNSVDWYDDDHTHHTPTRRISEARENGLDSHLMFKPNVNNNQGLTGLNNIGNTCFMNSVTQCLSNTRPLLEYFSTNKYKHHLNCDEHGSLTMEFARVLAKLWESSRKVNTYSNSITARDFKRVVSTRVRKFMGNDQHDAQEFLVYLIQGLHEETNQVKGKKKKVMLGDEWDKRSAEEKGRAAWDWYLSYDSSFFVSTFVGQLKSTLECTVCGYQSNTFDPFWDISLPIRKKSYSGMQLEECFSIFTEKEKLDGNESPMCAKCKKHQPCTKGLTLWRFPRILILELKRFEQHPSGFRATKLNTRVDFPTRALDLSPYTDCTNANVRPVYNLYAVVKHSGTPSGGHYTADAKHPYSKEWHTFNDASVSTQSGNRVTDSGAYVLFYELEDSHSKL